MPQSNNCPKQAPQDDKSSLGGGSKTEPPEKQRTACRRAQDKEGGSGTHLGGHDGQPHAIVGLVQLNNVDLRLAAGDGHGPVAHHTGAAGLWGTHTGLSTVHGP